MRARARLEMTLITCVPMNFSRHGQSIAGRAGERTRRREEPYRSRRSGVGFNRDFHIVSSFKDQHSSRRIGTTPCSILHLGYYVFFLILFYFYFLFISPRTRSQGLSASLNESLAHLSHLLRYRGTVIISRTLRGEKHSVRAIWATTLYAVVCFGLSLDSRSIGMRK